MSSDHRLATLEQRVAELERLVSSAEALRTEHPEERAGRGAPAATTAPTTAPPAARTPDPSVFWALEGLHARVEAPGAVLITGTVTLPDGRAAEWQEGATTDDLLGLDWAECADSLAALGHPVRLRLLGQVLSGARTVQELTGTEGIGTSGQVYHHVRQLVAAGWLRAAGGGRYEVPVARVVPLLTTVLGARR
ncbi:ArsR/SmtB family transcription factor [Georgenia wangjunii]|uniref:ArsR/SmtB family transcription factor n=1 Tax=Georgenia wangjunii TaxID=3117730 RepID=UPI002F264C2F